MYNVEVQINLKNSGYSTDLEEVLEALLADWNSSGQVNEAPTNWVLEAEQLRFTVLCPEPDALSHRIGTSYHMHRLVSIQLLTGELPQWTVKGRDPRFHGYEVPDSPRSLILHGGRSISPLVCGETWEAIPYYRFPELCDKDRGHDDLNRWRRRWDDMYNLWFSGFWEEQAQRQLEDHDSDLSKMGRAAAARIEKLTGLPTYYWLFNYRDISPEEDRARRCPETGLEWYIPGATTLDEIGFRCEESRLVSGLSKNSA